MSKEQFRIVFDKYCVPEIWDYLIMDMGQGEEGRRCVKYRHNGKPSNLFFLLFSQ
jgi:hypothetical protein